MADVLSESTKAQLDSLLRWIAENAQQGGEFVKDQAPLLAQDIVRWGIAFGAMIVAALLTSAVMLFLFARWGDQMHAAAKESKKKDANIFYEGEWLMISVWGRVLAIAAAAAGLVTGLPPMLKAIFSPRLYIVEELSRWLQ